MKRVFFVVLFISICTVVLQAEDGFQKKIGIGVAAAQDLMLFNSYGLTSYPISGCNIFIPIELSSKSRIEPEFGYFRSKTNYEDYYYDYETEYSTTRFGLGFFTVKRYSKSTISFGGRIGMIISKMKDTEDWDRSARDGYSSSSEDFYYGIATGGEYLLSEHISIGAEAQLNFLKLDSGGSGSDSSMVSTRGLVVLRFYY